MLGVTRELYRQWSLGHPARSVIKTTITQVSELIDEELKRQLQQTSGKFTFPLDISKPLVESWPKALEAGLLPHRYLEDVVDQAVRDLGSAYEQVGWLDVRPLIGIAMLDDIMLYFVTGQIPLYVIVDFSPAPPDGESMF